MKLRGWYWCVLALLVWVLPGCGGAPSADAKYAAGMPGGAPMSPESAPADSDGDAVMDSSDEAPMEEQGSYGAQMRTRATVAQAAGAAPPPAPGRAEPAKEKPDVGAPSPEVPNPTGGKNQAGESGGPAPSAAGPLLIYKATLHMAVFETKKSLDEVEKLAKDVGGYLVKREDQSITVRVPSKKFDGAVDRISKLGDMLHRNVSVDDVTEQFHDMQIRQRNLEVVRNRLEELLKKAANVTEAITVERELERVTTEIERLKGRLKYLSELIMFSTITVNFQPRPTDHVESQVRLPFPWLDSLGLGELLRL
jgi:hypothetical protein